MGDNPQLSLQLPAAYRGEEKWPEVLDAIRTVCTDLGRGEVVDLLDCSPSYLKNALVERDRHHLKAKELVKLVAADRAGVILRPLASLAGYELAPKRELTPEEKLDRLQRTLRARLGPLGDEIVKESER